MGVFQNLVPVETEAAVDASIYLEALADILQDRFTGAPTHYADNEPARIRQLAAVLQEATGTPDNGYRQASVAEVKQTLRDALAVGAGS